MRHKWGLNEGYFSGHNHNHHFFLALEKIRESGFDGVLMIDPRKYSLTLSEIKKGLKESELSLIQLHSDYFNMANPDPEERKKATEWYKKRVEYALELEAEQLVIHAGGETMCFISEEEMREAARRNAECLLKGAIKKAEGTNLKIVLENSGGLETRPRYLKEIMKKVKGTFLEKRIKEKGGLEPRYRFGTRPNHLIEVVKIIQKESNYKNIGICLDVGHAFASKLNVKEAIFEGGEYIISTHIHDNSKPSGEEDEHLLPGMGLIKWDEVMRAFKEISYAGPFVFEITLPESEKRDWDEKAKLVRESRRLLEDLLEA